MDKGSDPSRLQRIFNDWIFPGKCFPCIKTRVDENGKILPPPSCSDIMKYEAANAVGDENAPTYCFGRLRGYIAFDTGKSAHYYWFVCDVFFNIKNKNVSIEFRLFIINCAVIYNLIFVIGRAIFWQLQNLLPIGWYVLDYSSDFIYILDIVIRYA